MMDTGFDKIYQEIEHQAEKYLPANVFEALQREPDRRLIIYGAGGNCQSALYTSFYMGVTVEAICDSKVQGTYIYHHKNQDTTEFAVISPNQLINEYQTAFVLISTWNYEDEIKSSLIDSGFPENQIFLYRAPDDNMPAAEFREKHLDGYRWAYTYFQDKISRRNIVNRTRRLMLHEACPADSSYWDGYWGYPNIPYSQGEVYVDAGAYIGDTAEEFIQAIKSAGKSYSHIYAFEPDPHNFKIAGKRLESYANVDLSPSGLWSTSGTLSFHETSMDDYITSRVTENSSSVTVQVTALDSFFKDKPVENWPTLIKMDIEGLEKEALLGAAEIIKQKKPKLIICAYHKPEDIYELPRTILKLRVDYKLSLWQIGDGFWDLVLYGV